MANLYKTKNSYRQNHGVPGVVYILENEGLRSGFYKIGCTRKSGTVRANQLNELANTAVPGMYKCVFEYHTKDCGRAEELVHIKLRSFRKGKWGQEFFEVSVDEAKSVIINVAIEVDKAVKPTVESHKVEFERPRSRVYSKEPPKPSIVPDLIVFMVLGLIIWGASKLGGEVSSALKEGKGFHVFALFVVIVVVVNLCTWMFRRYQKVEVPATQAEPLSDSDWEFIEEVLAEYHGDQNALEPTLEAATSIEIPQGYSYHLIAKMSVDQAADIASTYSKWPIFLAELRDGDELWTYTAEGTSPDTGFDHMYGLAIVRDNVIVSHLLITASNDCIGAFG